MVRRMLSRFDSMFATDAQPVPSRPGVDTHIDVINHHGCTDPQARRRCHSIR